MIEKMLSVRLHGTPVGTLEQTLEGKLKFIYLDDAKQPISVAMPIQDQAYSSVACEAYFGGLLPEIELAPLYDILCTQVYPDLSSKMAMKIGGHYDANVIMPRHWQKLCDDVGYSYPALDTLIKKIASALLDAAEIERQALIKMNNNTSIIDKIIKIWETNIRHILNV